MALLSVPTFRDWGLTLLDLLFPGPPPEGKIPGPIEAPFCEQCGEPFSGAMSTGFRCANCADRDWHFTGARAYCSFEGSVRDAILGFKYHEQFYQRKHLIGWIVQGYDRHFANGEIVWDGLVPVPLHGMRRRERGFNQALELARGLSKARGVSVCNALTRLRETGRQARLSREERWRNLKNAFDLRSKFDVRGRNLLLIDDVFTTGATSEGCAHVLKKAGANAIGVLTVARG